jgi:hypothetical protein
VSVKLLFRWTDDKHLRARTYDELVWKPALAQAGVVSMPKKDAAAGVTTRLIATWSLSKLVEYLAEVKKITISAESVRQILRPAGIRWQATKTWKASKDPDLAQKMARILDLYDHPPADGRVLCVDEFGPLNLQPRPGRGWFPARHPTRLRATYNRTGGVRHMFAALDLATGQIFYRFRDRKR